MKRDAVDSSACADCVEAVCQRDCSSRPTLAARNVLWSILHDYVEGLHRYGDSPATVRIFAFRRGQGTAYAGHALNELVRRNMLSVRDHGPETYGHETWTLTDKALDLARATFAACA